jgi:hypothetical protein
MSLLFHRRAIARAVAGQLPAAAEGRLRAHLRGCASCRRHYDALSALAAGAAAGGAPPGGGAAAARERARLEAALGNGNGMSAGAAAPGPRRRRALILLAPATAALVVALVQLRRVRMHAVLDDQVTWRGGRADGEQGSQGEQADRALRAGLSLRFYARRRGPEAGPVRLLGELPGSGQLRASRADELQIAYLGLREPRYLALVGVDQGGEVHVYHPAATGGPPGPLSPTREPRLLGSSLDLGATHPAGRVRLAAVVTRQPPDVRALEAAVRARAGGAGARLPGEAHVDGLLWIEP